MLTISQYRHLEKNPSSEYLQLFIKGTRIRARVLYGLFAGPESQTPQEIAADYGLPLEAVQEAIAYCQSNPPELAEDYQREQRLVEAVEMNDPERSREGRPKAISSQQWAALTRNDNLPG